MRRRILALVALTMLVVPAAPASAAFHQDGWGASATWSSVPTDGSVPIIGATYAGTFLYASNENGFFTPGPGDPRPLLSIDNFTYRFVLDAVNGYADCSVSGVPDGTMCRQEFLSEWGGFALGNAVRLSIDGTFRSASVSGSIETFTCTAFDVDGICTDPVFGTGTLDAKWTGRGGIVRQATPYHEVTRAYTFAIGGGSTYRDAAASWTFTSATINTSDVILGVPFVDAEMRHFAETSTFVCHGPTAC